MGNDPDARSGDDAAGAGGDLVAEAAAELYGADPQEFTDRRKALSAAAKAAGDAAAAKQISVLRKPTRAAWALNYLARADPGAADRLTGLAAALRAAEQAKDGPGLRELSAARGPLIDTLTGQALAAAGVADPPAGLRDEVAATLTAAIADPEVAAAFAAGTLTRAAEWAGFGIALSGADTDDGTDDAQPLAAAEPAARPVPLRQGRGVRQDGKKAAVATASGQTAGEETAPQAESGQLGGPAGERRLRPARTPEEPAGERRLRLAGEADRPRERLAGEAAGEAARAADRRREVFADAERAVASATAAASDAVAAEDRLESEVRDLESRLTRARADLADARLRARRAETAERKARQVLDRLPPPTAPD